MAREVNINQVRFVCHRKGMEVYCKGRVRIFNHTCIFNIHVLHIIIAAD